MKHTGCATKQWLLCLSCSVKVDGSIQEVELAKYIPYSVARKHPSNCFVGTYRAHLLPMIFWKVDLVKQYTKLHLHVVFCMIWCKVNAVVPLMLTKIDLKTTCISHECLQSGLVLQFSVAFSHDYTVKMIGCFNRRVVTLVADKLRRQWLWEVYVGIGD